MDQTNEVYIPVVGKDQDCDNFILFQFSCNCAFQNFLPVLVHSHTAIRNYQTLDRVLHCCPGWSAVARSHLTATSASWVQASLMPQSPEQLGLQMHTMLRNEFCCKKMVLPTAGLHDADQSG
ncbi:protein FAM237B isoform X4 [Callithrix jacchus]|uniref:protein FAM237B isoform X7 n=1 Tax=Callithrix jacchus TaxID=9483 RepID=UPI00159CF469|nr:protein FAM237B isoform X7 [Callithrix jacchus]XP_054093310.1 protein FAM237B isoform X7 [Callithrix jacchus]XP_054093311.1 protein FAM237B isoform X7 [Callithrix jacchus]